MLPTSGTKSCGNAPVGHSDAVGYGSVHDTILFYSKADNTTWNTVFQPYDEEYVKNYYRYEDPDGRRWMSDNLSASGLSGGGYEYEWNGVTRVWRCPIETMRRLDNEGKIYYTKNGIARRKRYLDEAKGMRAQDIWGDIEPLRSWHQERLGYPTQKPLGLLERIIQASSNEGDWVLDPFCGCGTAVAAAQQLNRRWIGIDITHLAIALNRYRLADMFPGIQFKVIGEPQSISAARQLAQDNRHQFEWWALSLVKAQPTGGEPGSRRGKKGADRGMDGIITFIDDATGKPKRILVQVKSGHVSSAQVRDLVGTVDREKAAMGVFVTLEEPTQPMKVEALSAGYYHSPGWDKDYPKIQILTIDDLLRGAQVNMPQTHTTFKRAQKSSEKEGVQGELDL